MEIYCDECALVIVGEPIHISTDEGDVKFCRRCFEEIFGQREAPNGV